MKQFSTFLLLLLALGTQSAQARWQDDSALASARSQRMEWEARFVDAVANPEIDLVRIKHKKHAAEAKDTAATEATETDDSDLTVESNELGDSTTETAQPDGNQKPAKPRFKRVRNFVRYLAKVNVCRQQLSDAEAQYQTALNAIRAKNQDFRDDEYKRNPELDAALETWNAIVREVGEQAVQEASATYAGEETMLKNLTDGQKP